MHSREDTFVDAFIVPRKRERYRTFLANSKRRPKILSCLDHFHDIDPRYATDRPSNADVVALLRSRGAPEDCYLISNVPELNAREMPLKEAIEEFPCSRWGTLVCCILGRLGYYHGGDGEQRLLLERAT